MRRRPAPRVWEAAQLEALADVVAAWSPVLTSEELVAAADRELYRAKRDGRDRICVDSG